MFNSFKDITLFKKASEINLRITEFFNNVSEAGLLFEQGMKCFFFEQRMPEFEDFLSGLRKMEQRNDSLRRTIEASLYRYTLLPESRSDIVRLLENTDKLINKYESILGNVFVERPSLEGVDREELKEFISLNVKAVEMLIISARSFFSNMQAVENTVHKVSFYEKQVDKIAFDLKKKLFESEVDLAVKLQSRAYVSSIEFLSDAAEDIADELIIYTMKRLV